MVKTGDWILIWNKGGEKHEYIATYRYGKAKNFSVQMKFDITYPDNNTNRLIEKNVIVLGRDFWKFRVISKEEAMAYMV